MASTEGQKVFMGKGDGDDDSYTKNSTPQRSQTDAIVFPILDEVLQRVSLPKDGTPVVVADLGCSSARNSIVNVSYVVEALRRRSSKEPREFQVFLNDLPWNDFNMLFKHLCENEVDRSKFYAAGVPGSFFGRLFPRSSVHVFVSMSSVHFLSRIPDAVTDRSSAAFNRGNVWLDGASDATAEAYKEQSAEDLRAFLRARSEELVPGGLLFFNLKTRRARKANVLRAADDGADALQICVRETAEEAFSKGLLTEEQLNALNVPLYFSLFEEELMEVIKSFSSSFEILTAKEIGFSAFAPSRSSSEKGSGDPNVVLKTTIGVARSVLGGIFEQVLGKQELEFYWQHFAKVAENHASAFEQNIYSGYISMLRK